jgi:hypothetical protein
MLNLIAWVLDQGADTPNPGISGWYVFTAIAVLVVGYIIFKAVNAKHDKSVSASAEVLGQKLNVTGESHPPALPALADRIPTQTIRVVMEQRGSNWSEGTNDGKECVFIRIRAKITNVYNRPISLVKSRILPSGHEGIVGLWSSGPDDYPHGDEVIPHVAMDCVLDFIGLPRSVCPAPGDTLVFSVVIIDQYGNEHTFRNVECPFGG